MQVKREHVVGGSGMQVKREHVLGGYCLQKLRRGAEDARNTTADGGSQRNLRSGARDARLSWPYP